jgi:hypothetical protein
MKHASTQAVYAYWNARRGKRPAPTRAEIEPAAIRHALGDTFMLAADYVDELRFRLAGTRVCALICREIKGEAFSVLWGEQSVGRIEQLTSIVVGETVGAVAGLTAVTAEGDSADCELLLLPLARSGHVRIRALGVLAPLTPPYWLGERPVTELRLGTVRHIGGDLMEARRLTRASAAPPLAADRRRPRHGLIVLKGGRETPPDERSA